MKLVFKPILECKSATVHRFWQCVARQWNAWPIKSLLQLSVILSCLTNRLGRASTLSYPLREKPKLPGMPNVNSWVLFMIGVLARVLSHGSWPLWSRRRALLMSEGQCWGKGPPIKGARDVKHETGFLEARSSKGCSYWRLCENTDFSLSPAFSKAMLLTTICSQCFAFPRSTLGLVFWKRKPCFPHSTMCWQFGNPWWDTGAGSGDVTHDQLSGMHRPNKQRINNTMCSSAESTQRVTEVELWTRENISDTKECQQTGVKASSSSHAMPLY